MPEPQIQNVNLVLWYLFRVFQLGVFQLCLLAKIWCTFFISSRDAGKNYDTKYN
jgi:hypothetical protein